MSDKVLIDRDLLKELVSSLEGEVESRYSNGIKDHPAMKRDYECDIEPVIRGKELLAAAPAAPVVQAEPVATVVERKEGSRTWFDGVIHATAIVMGQIKDGDPLYATPPAPDAVLVEALATSLDECIKEWDGELDSKLCIDFIGRAREALAAYRAALAGKGGE